MISDSRTDSLLGVVESAEHSNLWYRAV